MAIDIADGKYVLNIVIKGNITVLIWFSGLWKVWKSQGIKFEIREAMERSGNFGKGFRFCQFEASFEKYWTSSFHLVQKI